MQVQNDVPIILVKTVVISSLSEFIINFVVRVFGNVEQDVGVS